MYHPWRSRPLRHEELGVFPADLRVDVDVALAPFHLVETHRGAGRENVQPGPARHCYLTENDNDNDRK